MDQETDKIQQSPDSAKTGLSNSAKDLILIAVVFISVFILSYYFNVFLFLVKLFDKYPWAITYIDEILTGLLTLSISFAIFAWRRWRELKKETAKRLALQEEIITMANTKTETERIIVAQLRSEIDYRKQLEKENFIRPPKKG